MADFTFYLLELYKKVEDIDNGKYLSIAFLNSQEDIDSFMKQFEVVKDNFDFSQEVPKENLLVIVTGFKIENDNDFVSNLNTKLGYSYTENVANYLIKKDSVKYETHHFEEE